MNGNARRLRGRLRRRLERALPGGVRFTKSLADARATIYAEIRRGVDAVILGGGDGTVVMGLTLIAEACRGEGRAEPAIGILRLGSGNAIADTVGATADIASDLEQLANGGGKWRRVRLVEALGVRAPFIGMGIDAQLLEDQEAFSKVVDRVPGVRRVLTGGTRYALSVAMRSVPRYAIESRPVITVTNLGAPAIAMSRMGPTGVTIPTGSVVWTGRCTLVAASTIPFFGFGLKMFAFSDAQSGRFHLRCGDVGLLEMLQNIPAAFRGDYFSDHVQDFLCDRVAIEVEGEAAIEAGGELLGRKHRVELAISAPVTLISLSTGS